MDEINQEKPAEETPQEPVVEAAAPAPVDDRPEINYKMELERRKAEADRLRQELEVERGKQVNRRDPNDISTWGDNELVNIKNSNSPDALPYKQQAEDILFERKMNKVLERERLNAKRTNSEMELRTKYPEALNPYSEFSTQMEQVMFDLDLQKSPAGRLAAARIVAGESSKGSSKANAAGRKAEEARLKDVKQTLSEGDRPDPRAAIPNPKKHDELMNIVNSRDSKVTNEAKGAAMGKLLKDQGIDFNKFFGR
jgi:hypothetical protein